MRAAHRVRLPGSPRFLARGCALLLAATLCACAADGSAEEPAPEPESASDATEPAWNEAESEVPARRVLWRVIDHDEVPRNEEFSLEVRVLSGDLPTALDRLDLRGWMPDHGHGFVQDPQVHELELGRYRVDGVMLHMRGTWELRLQLFDANGLDVVVLHVEL